MIGEAGSLLGQGIRQRPTQRILWQTNDRVSQRQTCETRVSKIWSK